MKKACRVLQIQESECKQPLKTKLKEFARFLTLAVILASILPLSISEAKAAENCERTITADVVALDQPFFYNRLGAINTEGMIFALKRDVVPKDPAIGLTPGNVMLRSDKRPRPLTLRMNVGDCLEVNFTNLLSSTPIGNQPATRTASVHVTGMQLVDSIASDGSNVGNNSNSLVAPGGNARYKFYAERENTYLLYSTGATTGGEGDGGTLSYGLFGAVNVEPKGAEWYRSQVTNDDLELSKTGTTPDGHPIINYDAVYPPGHKFSGVPILKMLNDNNEIVHSDINAIITGPNKGNFPEGTYKPNPVNVPLQSDEQRSRNEPFREFTTIFHDEIAAIQAFPGFYNDPVLGYTLHGVRDAFAINYGTGGIGSEIIANRLGVGPMFNCTECKYEEFFLTSWAVGDPAMVVDVPANQNLLNLKPGEAPDPAALGPKATKALYPDDPSNVHHSYIGDHVKFRNLHAGPKEHHIFHLHAHQWLFTPDSDNSTYLDSQMIGPGSGYTYEITYNGAGNRNKEVGDAIFHCHFYPHFAMGMWEMWRAHDVFESGTQLDADGNPVPGSRALPDAEIKNGTAIPGVVPIPVRPMAPMPESKVQIIDGQVNITALPGKETIGNPGYPFFIPGEAGHRPPHPPLDTLDDGGLPRHIITGGTAESVESRTDFSKELLTAITKAIPEEGTDVEKAAMDFHANRTHPSFLPTNGAPASFVTNGLPPAPGAPYADPCVDDFGNAVGTPRNYSAAVIQLDAKFNKVGWHFPQQRMLSLWGDVDAFLNGTKPPEPFFFRANTNNCINFNHTNLAPGVYEQDDYQVRTPTDIIGQHIHLVKFDVTSSDGSANGWNYEDGTFSPDEVRERIHAINNGTWNGAPGNLEPKAHPYFGPGPNGKWLGAQTTRQRWYADNVLNMQGKDRTLRTVYTHDHYGPSSHQQIGLYSGLVIEPENSTWRNPESGAFYGGRFDGGPTSWRADILTQDVNDSYREFMFEFGDFQHAYKAGGGLDAQGNPIPDPVNVINPPAKDEVGLPYLLLKAGQCKGGVPLPCPEAISVSEPGTMVVNYRNEPIALRVLNDDNGPTFSQANGDAGDLSMVYRSNINRAIPALNIQPGFYPPLTKGIQPGDPFTPLLRVYENDKVQIRTLVGSQEEGHNFNIQGVKWLQEPSDPNSGYRNTQGMGISEHFEFEVPSIMSTKGRNESADYLYESGSAVDDRWNGIWGIMRAYNGGLGLQPDLLPLPNNPDGKSPPDRNPKAFNGICPTDALVRKFSVNAVTAAQVLPNNTLVYNNRAQNGGPLNDPTAILYVNGKDLDSSGKLKPGVPIEPLILRANAGDCIDVTLTNNLPATLPDQPGFSTLPMIIANFQAGFNTNQLTPSSNVGLHPQFVLYDILKNGAGANIGFNPLETAVPGGLVKYRWYAGDIQIQPDGSRIARPIEFGATNLMPSDPIKHSNKGAIGALIIEPLNSTWVVNPDSRASATVNLPDGSSFREFVLLFQDDINMRFGSTATLPSEIGLQTFNAGDAVPNTAAVEAPEDSGQKALNYRTEPFWFRMGFAPTARFGFTGQQDYTNVNSNVQVGGDPKTPVFTAAKGTPVRFRVLSPGGHARNSVFNLYGHTWEREPYTNESTKIGDNILSQWIGSQEGHGPTNHFDVMPKHGAGGAFNVPGDYLYRNQESDMFSTGQWGIFRVN